MMKKVIAVIAGCNAMQPNRAQSQTFSENAVYIMVPAGFTATNIIEVIAGASSLGDIFTQNMIVTTGGNESNAPTAQNPDIKTDVTVPLGDSALNALVGAGAKGITEGLSADSEDCAPGEDCADPQP